MIVPTLEFIKTVAAGPAPILNLIFGVGSGSQGARAPIGVFSIGGAVAPVAGPAAIGPPFYRCRARAESFCELARRENH
jgi:hypothetical protein